MKEYTEYPDKAGYYWTEDESGGCQIGHWLPGKQFLMFLGSKPERNGLDDKIVLWRGPYRFRFDREK